MTVLPERPDTGRADRGENGDQGAGPPLYILITQCLQNDFFLSLDCRLGLPDAAVAKFLADPDNTGAAAADGHRRTFSAADLRCSPLARFLDATIGTRLRGHGDGVLHLINLRDWHVQGESYEQERRAYGAHCEAGSWGARYIDGLAPLLDPPPDTARQTSGEGLPTWGGGRLLVHHIRSPSLFDFQHSASGHPVPGAPSALAGLMDELLTDGRYETAHVAVIGVLTDIKIQLLLTELRSRYHIRRLVVSDALTASRTLERHLSALDFCERVLHTEVMDGLAELVRFLGCRPEDDRALVRGDAESGGSTSYFRDRQGILSYEDARLRDYRLQTADRLRQTQHLVGFASRFLLGLGAVLLLSALVLSLVGAVLPERIAWQVPAVFGALGAGQIVTVFFTRPVRSLQDALAQETIYRMVLESRSLKVALARFHVTAARALHRRTDPADHMNALERQLELLERIDTADFERLRALGVPSPTSGIAPTDPEPGQRPRS